MSTSIEHVRCLIIGSGPAGYSAAIYAARADLKPVLFEGPLPGGQLTQTTEVENYPGYPDGVTGPEMMEQFKKQAGKFGTRFLYKTVTRVDFTSRPFKVYSGEEVWEAKTVIIAGHEPLLIQSVTKE